MCTQVSLVVLLAPPTSEMHLCNYVVPILPPSIILKSISSIKSEVLIDKPQGTNTITYPS